ncbi:unnamed protein product, partial [Brassica oleracea var. botrytis]
LANKLLLLIDTAYNWIKHLVGNGETTYFWTSHWSPFGNIRKFLVGESCMTVGIPYSITLAELWVTDHWFLPPARSEKQWYPKTQNQNLVDGTKLHRTLLLLAWQGSLYTFWTERNSRLHRDSFRSSSSIISEIDHTIRRRIASLRSAQPTQASALLQMWFSNSPPH